MNNFNILQVPLGKIKADVLYVANILQAESDISTPFHYHHYLECHVIVSGKCIITTEKSKYNLNSGDICVIPKLMAHTVEHSSGDLKKGVLTFTFERGKKETYQDFLFFNSVFNIKDVFVVNDQELCDWLLNNAGSGEEDAFQKIKRQAVFSFFLIRISEIITSSEKLNMTDNTGAAFDERIFFIEEYISTEYASDASLAKLSKIMHISERQINRILKKYVGRGFCELLSKQRMIVAVELLERKEIPITEIADKVGFESYSGFYSAFKKSFGVSPEYMREKRAVTKQNVLLQPFFGSCEKIVQNGRYEV